MKRLFGLFFFITLLVLQACSRLAAGPDVVGSIVKIYSECYAYSYLAPWQLIDSESVIGSGCIIAGNRILTNAHVVANAKFIQVKRAGTEDKMQAEVEAIAHPCDLAILKVKDPKFFDGSRPLDIGNLVAIRDRVTAYGFPEGGEELSLTEGIVSRIEVHKYAHGEASLLCGQIDAAINDGSSGGPVIKDGRVVGIAFQAGSGENISYMVPSTVVQHFLEDVKDGKYDGFPSLEISWQAMENRHLRSKCGLDPSQSGVLINRIYPGSPVEGLLKTGDVVQSVAGRAVANDGTVEFRKNERTIFYQRVQEFFIGDTIQLEVLRNGETLSIPIKLTLPINSTRLVPHFQYDVQPSYFILGGLVFQRLTLNYLRLWDENNAPSHLRSYYFYGEPSRDRRNVIILTSVLADETNLGYQDMTESVIVLANGRTISTLVDLVDAVESNTQPYHVFMNEHGKEIVLDREKAVQRHPLILKRYKIDSDRSEDLKARTKTAF